MAGSISARKVMFMHMMARRQLIKLVQRNLSSSSCRRGGGGEMDVPGGGEFQPLPIGTSIGNREVVGYGYNGMETYADTFQAPFPAIRFKEETPEIAKIIAKEKGDWKKMTLEEKKALYRHSFCQTFAELHEPTGEWKKVGGITLFFVSLAIWAMIWMKMYVYAPLPETMTNQEHIKKNIQKMIDMRVNPVQGMSSHYDYEKNEWKD